MAVLFFLCVFFSLKVFDTKLGKEEENKYSGFLYYTRHVFSTLKHFFSSSSFLPSVIFLVPSISRARYYIFFILVGYIFVWKEKRKENGKVSQHVHFRTGTGLLTLNAQLARLACPFSL
jgi:hypothetical protein